MGIDYKGVEIEDTFAEAFTMWGSRIIITAINKKWGNTAASCMTGFATSVIACDCEAGVDIEISSEETPDGRPGIAVMLFGFSRKSLSNSLLNRIGQCVLTCPTTAVYNGLPEERTADLLDVGKSLRYFGDGHQVKMRMDDGWLGRRRFWRIPVMEGEFIIEDKLGAKKGVAGGNLLIMGKTEDSTLEASEKAVEAIRRLPEVITPFPGGLCRSGSKVGSQYSFLKASTNTPFCPIIKNSFEGSKVPDDVNSIIEIIINGFEFETVKKAMAAGINRAVRVEGIKKITAVNFGGKLGKHKLFLKDCLEGS